MENNIDDIRAKYKLGGVQHKIIAALCKHDMDTFELKSFIQSKLPAPDLRRHINALVRDKVLLSVGNDTWSITTVGLNISVLLGAVPDNVALRRRNMADRICNGNATGTYMGEELGRTCFRPGAYDAFLLPSRMGDNLHFPRKGRVEAVQ